jgi:L-ascorbate 6-phosphate lactonase
MKTIATPYHWVLLDKNPDLKIVCDNKSADIISLKLPGVKVQVPEVGTTLDWGHNVEIKVVPSAHTKLNITEGLSEYNGYVMRVGTHILYHPGDTIPHRDIEKYLPSAIDMGFMPINERNFFRDEMDIIGNMTSREALQWSQELGIKTIVPTHWDMFSLNSTDPQEFEFIAKQYKDIEILIPERFKQKSLE